MTHALARLLTACLILASLAAPAPSSAQGVGTAGAGARGDIVVIGNRRIETATVISYLALEPGEPVTAQALNASVRRLFDTGLFSDADITVDGGQLVVRVEENPSINRIAFEGNGQISNEQLLAAITSRPRRPFTRSRAEADAQVISSIYRQLGRYGTTVEPVIIALPDNRVDLVFEIDESPVTGVNSIAFVGNEVFSDYRLRRVIETSESGIFSALISSDIYDPARLEFDKELLRDFYLSRGHADFTVLSAVAELSPKRDGFFITFTIEEGPVYAFGEQSVSTTNPALDPAAFEALIDGEPGDTYDASVVERNIDRMVFLAGQQGFAFTRVIPRAIRDPEGLTIGVVYELIEGERVYVERIEIEGNTRTLDRVIRRQFRIAEGDAFNSRELDEARRRIRALGFFSQVEVTTEPGATDDRSTIRVKVEERSTGSISFGAGFSSSDGVVGEVSVTERNFLGRGQFVRARAVISGDRQLVDLTFREPAFLDRDLNTGFTFYVRQDDRSDESSFEETNVGFEPSVSFPTSEFGRLELRYRISDDEIRDVRDDASEFIKVDEGNALTSSLGYTYSYDRRNDPLEPTQGYLLRFGQDFAGVGGDAQYVRTTALARAFTSFFDEDVIASVEVEAGNITTFGDDLRITDRFFLGGDQFRGFERDGIGPRDQTTDDALGGNNFAVARAEVSFPLGLPEEFGIYGGVFSDVGTIWGLDSTTVGGTTVDDDPKLRATVGASLFWETGFGPLRLNFAYPVVDEEGDKDEFFRFTVGTRF
ncbi:MAG: outer membrane protein assembly factor BamA [Rubrimonas sp.]|uniref:outer membrane protein assembly factor BamA n=1 Tax=Rubrimonas sp. TaxID=2036015 RepID=UPI002FDED04E